MGFVLAAGVGILGGFTLGLISKSDSILIGSALICFILALIFLSVRASTQNREYHEKTIIIWGYGFKKWPEFFCCSRCDEVFIPGGCLAVYVLRQQSLVTIRVGGVCSGKFSRDGGDKWPRVAKSTHNIFGVAKKKLHRECRLNALDSMTQNPSEHMTSCTIKSRLRFLGLFPKHTSSK